MIPRFYSSEPLSHGASIDLPPNAAHHAIRVLRLRDGAALTLFDGTGGEWRATLKVGGGGTATAMLDAPVERDCESPLAITLVQALPSGDKMDWVLEKCVELGVAAIQPVTTKRSVIRLSPERMARRLEHWRTIATAACEQCGRNRLPVVAPVLDLPHYLATAKTTHAERLILAPEGKMGLSALPRPEIPIIVMVGPEGGWEENELRAAQTAGFRLLRLGPRILRTETAGMAALAAMQAVWGDFGVDCLGLIDQGNLGQQYGIRETKDV